MDISSEILSLVGGKKRTKKPKIFDSDEEEEGEIDVGDLHASPTDQPSAQQAEHSTQTLSEPSSDHYDNDLMGDEKDRQFLASLPEVEREAVLFERSEARRLKQERIELKHKLLLREGKGKAKPVAQPEKKRKTKRQQERYSSDFTDEESYRESEESAYEEEAEEVAIRFKQPQREPSKFESEITYEQALQLTLRRDHVEKLIGRIFFEDAVADAFVRISSGVRDGGAPVYRFAQIHSVVDYPKEYRFNETETAKAFNLIYGKSKRVFRIDLISNSPVTQQEFDRWKLEMSNCSLSLPSQHQAQMKIDQIRAFDNQAVTDSEINALVEQKRKSKKAIRNFTAEKIALLSMRDAAAEAGDKAEIHRLDEQILTVEAEAMKHLSGQYADQSSRTARQGTFMRRPVTNIPVIKQYTSGDSKSTDMLDAFARRRCNPTIIHLDTSAESIPQQPVEEPVSEHVLQDTDSLAFPTTSPDYRALHMFHIDGIEKNSLGVDESSFESYLLTLPKNTITLGKNSLPSIASYNKKFNYW